MDYDAYNAAQRERRGEGPTFTLAGQDWQCRPGRDIAAIDLLDPMLDTELAGFAHGFLAQALGVESYQELLEATRKAKPPIIIDTLIKVALDLVKEYTARPTAPSSSTASGQHSDGDGSKKKPARKTSAA